MIIETPANTNRTSTHYGCMAVFYPTPTFKLDQSLGSICPFSPERLGFLECNQDLQVDVERDVLIGRKASSAGAAIIIAKTPSSRRPPDLLSSSVRRFNVLDRQNRRRAFIRGNTPFPFFIKIDRIDTISCKRLSLPCWSIEVSCMPGAQIPRAVNA